MGLAQFMQYAQGGWHPAEHEATAECGLVGTFAKGSPLPVFHVAMGVDVERWQSVTLQY